MNASKIVDQYYEDTKNILDYKEWDIQNLITELIMSGQGELELYKSCEDMSDEEFKDMWDGIQALRKAVLAALGLKD